MLEKSFDDKLDHFFTKFEHLKRMENDLKFQSDALGAEFGAWLKELGVPENFNLVDVMKLVRRKVIS